MKDEGEEGERMQWLRTLRAAARLVIAWDVFKHAFDAAAQDEALVRRFEIVLASEPALGAEYSALKALWMPVGRALRDLRG